MVDIFSKYCVVVPIKTKQPDDVLEGIKECIKQHQAKPDSIYSDEEGSFISKKVQYYLRTEGIRHIITRGDTRQSPSGPFERLKIYYTVG